MRGVKAIYGFLKTIDSLYAGQMCITQSLSHLATRFSLYTSPLEPRYHAFHPSCFNQKLYLSSKPDSVVELLLANDWSDGLEGELQKSCPSMTHETVVYILKKLEKNPEKVFGFFNWVNNKNLFITSSSMYSLLLRILATKQTMKQFWITLRVMKEKGFFIDQEAYVTILRTLKMAKMEGDSVALTHFYNRMMQESAMGNVVAKVVDVISGSEWTPEVENDLARLKILPSDNFVLRVLKELRHCPLKAFKFFHWVGKGSDYEHNSVTYNAVARVIARDDSIEEFWSIIEEMKSGGHEMDIDTYVKISRNFLKNKMIEDAVKLYELMMDGPYKPSTQDCSVLLKCISGGDPPNLDLVDRVVKKYASCGHTLSKAIYDGVHRSLTGAGKFDEAEKIIEVMRNDGYEPDNITYSQLVFGLCKVGRLEEACRVLDEMESCGCIPDIKTWTILIQGHCAANEVEKALLCFARMIEKGGEADADLLDVLVDGFLNKKKIDGAYNLLLEIVGKCHVSPWQATYKKLINKLLEVSKLDEALELLRLMKQHNFPPFSEPFVKYISQAGTVTDAEEFLKVLSVKNYPSSSTYLHIFESFFKEGRHYEAKDLLYKCPPHIRTHNKICELFGSAKSSTTASASLEKFSAACNKLSSDKDCNQI
ncbi:pentatricopeptide repeat-containing protein At3g48250, chloroplastic-like [Neltuma alba]|uniref:pentatricopeptide repeat-containing protein At3g48250, chloroplastic-like n=1 Tax=Neltuma alba TaxID=207710 RepID=UPI0010A50951|nr:pentatricopeptide repeat-containing protein At3g48250, chloroplastic-like [Prosopis alba]XP_028798104.1 pentatricopeptide repeat-containing protein At3g48250, chloroplastic-like [Prosopis alba]